MAVGADVDLLGIRLGLAVPAETSAARAVDLAQSARTMPGSDYAIALHVAFCSTAGPDSLLKESWRRDSADRPSPRAPDEGI
jgi:hypothetical protein